ncbi:MAG: nucleotide exchange factor GrpE [Desulfovibrio sp.]|nr:nucleotide exchange factor GrpE [Desulfovibrio sp.]
MTKDREIEIVEENENAGSVEEPANKTDQEVSEPVKEAEDDVVTDQPASSEEAAPQAEEATAFEGNVNYSGSLFPPSQEVEALKAQMEEMRLRQAAEMENFKKRLAREQNEQMQYAAEKVLRDLLPTLDNLELAMQYGTTNEVCKDLLQGVAMTHKLLLECVQKHGLKQVGLVGEDFDPNIHEAVGFEQHTDQEQGKVARVLQAGYTLGNRLLRPARVMIAQPA